MTLVRPTASLPLPNVVPLHARLQALPGASVRHVPAACGGDAGERGGEIRCDPGALGLVQVGAVAVCWREGARRWPILSIMGAGDLIWYEPLCGSERSGSLLPTVHQVRALIPSRVLSVSAGAVRDAMAADPSLAWTVAGAVAASLAATERRLGRTLGRPVEGRLLDLLTDLAARFGGDVADGRRIALPLRQEDLASMAGATRESVNRALAALAARGLIRRSGRRLVVRYTEEGSGRAGPS